MNYPEGKGCRLFIGSLVYRYQKLKDILWIDKKLYQPTWLSEYI